MDVSSTSSTLTHTRNFTPMNIPFEMNGTTDVLKVKYLQMCLQDGGFSVWSLLRTINAPLIKM